MQNITTIKLYSDSLYPTNPSGSYLDLDDKTAIPLNFAISEIRDISKRKGTFSKSITVPSTKNNNKILNNYFDVNIQAGTFDINKLQRCAIIQNGIVILDNAIIQLVSVNKSETNSASFDSITYTLLVKDTTSDFFTTINNKYLNDIDFSELNHVFTGSNVISSFNNTVTDGYKYVMPYNSPDLDTVGADAQFNLEEFAPAIYVKKYLDKIFASAGYSYSFPTMDDPDVRLSNLLIPYNGDVVRTSREESSIYTASANRTLATGLTGTTAPIHMTLFGSFNSTSYFPGYVPNTGALVPNNETNDPNGDYNPITGTYVTPNVPSTTNSIKAKYTVEYEVKVVNTGGTKYFCGHKGTSNPPFFNVYDTLVGVMREIIPTVTVMDNTTPFNIQNVATNNRIYIPHGTAFPIGTTILGTSTQTFETEIPGLTPGHSITLKSGLDYFSYYTSTNTPAWQYNNQCWNFYNTPIPELRYNQGGSTTPAIGISLVHTIKNVYVTYTSALDGDYGFNVPLKMNKFIPQKIKQSDFVKSLFTMFNLYIEVDPTIPNRLNIFKRNEYYDSGKIVDWTNKLVKDKAQEIKFIPEITNKKQIFTYKQDQDWANTRYKEATNEVYGQAEFIFDNEYVKETTTTELIFSPTPVANTSFGAVCPIWNGQAPQNNIRILFDGGELSCGSYTIQNYPTNIISNTTYPCITHWDKPTAPTFDLNWLPCDFYFRSDNYGADTNNNLFNLHWRRTMEQINSGKIMTAYFMIDAYDIQTMKLNDKIRIDNSWWNINSIKDYDANAKGPTKVELISIDENLEIPFVVQQSTPLAKGSPILSVLNDLAKSKIPFVNTILSNGNVTITGRGNLITSNVSNVTIFGDNNAISSNATVSGSNNIVNSPAIIQGDFNTVEEGLTNVSIFGSGFTAETSDTAHFNQIMIADGGTINGQDISTIVGPSSSSSLWTAGTGLESIVQVNTLGLNTASGDYSIAVGYGNVASGANSNAEGANTTASGGNSHAEGGQTIASGIDSHAEGQSTEASGDNSHSEGLLTISSGANSHAEGESNESLGDNSHAGGAENTASTYAETVIGRFASNISGNATAFATADPVFRIGIGTSTGSRSDAFRVYKNGAAYLKPITPGSITSPVVGMIAFDSSTNDLKIYNGTAWVAVGSTNMTNQLIIMLTSGSAFSIIKDDLGIGGSTSIVTSSSSGPYRVAHTISFPGSVNANNVVANFENDSWFTGDSGSGDRSSSGSTITLRSGKWNTSGFQPTIIGTVITFNIY